MDTELNPAMARLITLNVFLVGEKNRGLIPEGIDPRDNSVPPKNVSANESGHLLGEGENVQVNDFFQVLSGKGYELVDAFYRVFQNSYPQKGWYFRITLTFCHPDYIEQVQDDFRKKRDHILAAMEQLVSSCLWRAKIHQNPFFHEHEAVEGFGAISIKLDKRVMRVYPDGTPVLVWPGEKKIGEKVPLSGNFVLKAEPGLKIVPA